MSTGIPVDVERLLSSDVPVVREAALAHEMVEELVQILA
jgi:hypothetical protein